MSPSSWASNLNKHKFSYTFPKKGKKKSRHLNLHFRFLPGFSGGVGFRAQSNRQRNGARGNLRRSHDPMFGARLSNGRPRVRQYDSCDHLLPAREPVLQPRQQMLAAPVMYKPVPCRYPLLFTQQCRYLPF